MERVQIVGAEAKDQGGQYFSKMSSGKIVYHSWAAIYHFYQHTMISFLKDSYLRTAIAILGAFKPFPFVQK